MTPREARIFAAKKASQVTTKPYRLVMEDEIFVYEGGTLVEYEYNLPQEYTEFPEHMYEDTYAGKERSR